MTKIPAINRTKLLKTLGLPDKVPPTFTKTFHHVYCPDRRGEVVLLTDVVVLPSNGKDHRIQVKCQRCETWVVFGRYHQHVGTGTCRAV